MNIRFFTNDLMRFEKEMKIIKANIVIIDATDDVKITALEFNDEGIKNQITNTIDAEINDPGKVILPNEVFSLLKKDTEITITDNKIIVGSRVINLNLESGGKHCGVVSNFDKKVFKLTDKDIKQLMEVEHAISKDSVRPVLNGVRIEDDRFFTTDGYRLSERTGDFNCELPVTISNYKMLKALRGNIKATTDGKYIKYEVGNYTYYNKLIEGDFLDINRVKPQSSNINITIDREELLGSLKSMKNICKDRKHSLVTIEVLEDNVEVEAINDKMKVTDTVKCEGNKDDKIKVGINCNYLIDAIKTLDDKIEISFIGDTAPIVIKGDNRYELLLPIRISK